MKERVVDGRQRLVVFRNEAVDEGDEILACRGKDEFLGAGVPEKLEVRAGCGNPDLAHGGVGRDDKFVFELLEEDTQRAVLIFDFEAGVLFIFARNQVALERVERYGSGAPEVVFVQHGAMPAPKGKLGFTW